jgi:hypothetical protein
LPSGVFPEPLMVVIFPSFDTSAADFPISFPSLFTIASVLLALMRLMDRASAPPGAPDPVMAPSLPS